jgi:type II secretory pathway pseudopilin PulG
MELREEEVTTHRPSLATSLRKTEGGFTFIELILALALLAASMTVFIGLQAAAVQRTIRDRNVQQAMLAARRIMAAIDTNPTILEQGNIAPSPLPNLFSQLGFRVSGDATEQEVLSYLQGELIIENWALPVPNIEENPLRKLTLRIAWSPDPVDRFELVYYIPIDDQSAPPV